jgi:hypothetical protein
VTAVPTPSDRDSDPPRLCPCGTGNRVTMSTTDPDSSAGLTPSEQLDEDELGTDPLEEAAEPEETWSGVDRHGTTPREQRTGTPLDERLNQEEDDFGEGL